MLKIDPEFESIILPLAEDEFQLLEENILAEGKVISPMVVWNGLVIDGHNRYRVIRGHPEVKYSVYEKDFPDRYAAIAWICKNQLGRRNLTLQQKKYLIGQRYEAEKMSHGASDGFRGNQHSNLVSSQNGNLPDDSPKKTCQRIAEETQTSKNYVMRAGTYAKGINAAEETLPGIKEELLSGRLKATDAAVTAVAKAAPEERAEKVELLRHPPEKSKKEKIQKEKPEKTGEIEKSGKKDISESIPGSLTDDEPGNSEETEKPGRDENAGNAEEAEEKIPAFTPRQKRAMEIETMRQIGERMAAPTGVMTVKDILYELNDAVETMTDRWDMSREMYPALIATEECRIGIEKLVTSTIEYLKSFKGGKNK